MPMKKTIYGTLGLVGACAACCAIPIVLPMLAGASLAGAAGASMLTVAVAASIAGLGIFLRRRALQARSGASCAVAPGGHEPSTGSCGCSVNAGSAAACK
jgi:apolipoprotein N-acyltransferase